MDRRLARVHRRVNQKRGACPPGYAPCPTGIGCCGIGASYAIGQRSRLVGRQQIIGRRAYAIGNGEAAVAMPAPMPRFDWYWGQVPGLGNVPVHTDGTRVVDSNGSPYVPEWPPMDCPPSIPFDSTSVKSAFQPKTRLVVEPCETDLNQFPLTFSQSVAASGTVNISVNSQRTFRPERLVVSSETALFFDILSINIRQTNQFADATPVAAECFTEDSLGTDIFFDTVEPGVLVSLNVRNNDAANARFFSASMTGSTVS